ncbi:hypothetical protein VEZ01S_16_00440 [Vibrio ezurae NBRC 102218]|uniref:Uncharacterized protein n=2 Tax=Vibrio ezurae TaxID=252583 RepID=U3B0I7_9VIBR|nr:hypothetical protein VEZ01S_16_00440 [Vibrio ezurae NBRC 102218]
MSSMSTSERRHKIAAYTLCILSPLIAEYLLGIWSFSQLQSLVFLLPFYGVGALLIREFSRRYHLGWRGIFCLSLAFGLLEEGIITSSFFNPNYYHAGLLSFAYLDWLGTSFFWVVYALGLHSLGSICVPILITELNIGHSLRNTPWLGKPALFFCGVVFAIAAASIHMGTQAAFPYRNTHIQTLLICLLILLLLIVSIYPKTNATGTKTATPVLAPSHRTVFLTTFTFGLIFFGQHYLKITFGMTQQLVPLSMLASYCGGMLLLLKWSKAGDWGDAQQGALAKSIIVMYSGLGLYQFSKGSTSLGFTVSTADVLLQVVLIVCLLVMTSKNRQRKTLGD